MEWDQDEGVTWDQIASHYKSFRDLLDEIDSLVYGKGSLDHLARAPGYVRDVNDFAGMLIELIRPWTEAARAHREKSE